MYNSDMQRENLSMANQPTQESDRRGKSNANMAVSSV
jgi:hypothetical protein